MKGDAQNPMQPVFDLPVLAGGLKDLLGVGLQAGDEVAALCFGLAINRSSLLLRLCNKALCFHECDALELGPTAFVYEASPLDINRPAATDFHTPMPPVHVGVTWLEASV
ncbi:MAG: hypothetical protein BRD30_01275 [Bacteroidetes bacterium QH_2_63_10]|nr:MAG: hypothetical protein BRD30_01275 [Bacteroidetes bacterium QH_2_63_10]